MPLILFNIGWMKYYRGLIDDDRIFNGGRYIEENQTGAEVENFLPKDGFCYGYVGVSVDHRINLRRLCSEDDARHVDDITVIFTATRPEGGRVVVGWYSMPGSGEVCREMSTALIFCESEDKRLYVAEGRRTGIPYTQGPARRIRYGAE